jgi:hypothetical protein
VLPVAELTHDARLHAHAVHNVKLITLDGEVEL